MSRAGDVPLLAMLVALSAWLGAAVIVAAIVAPAAFAVLPSRMLAGALVGRVLPMLFWSGAILGLVVAVRAVPQARGPSWLAATGVLLALAGAGAQLVVAPRIERVRASIGGVPMDVLDSADPRRIAFGRLHGLSLLSLAVAMLSAVAAIWLCTRLLTQRSIP